MRIPLSHSLTGNEHGEGAGRCFQQVHEVQAWEGLGFCFLITGNPWISGWFPRFELHGEVNILREARGEDATGKEQPHMEHPGGSSHLSFPWSVLRLTLDV